MTNRLSAAKGRCVCMHACMYVCRLFMYTCLYVEMVEQTLFAVVLHDKPSQCGEEKVCMYACMHVCMYVYIHTYVGYLGIHVCM